MRPLAPLAFLLCALFSLAVLPGRARAAWPNQQNVNLPVCLASGNQTVEGAVSDGAGGAFALWVDTRNLGTTGNDVYLHHILARGTVDPAWPTDGLAVCALAGDQLQPVMFADGTGGVFVAWEDHRGANWAIYASRITAAGALAAGWPANGIKLNAQTQDCVSPQICSDGAGGIYVAYTWQFLTNDFDPMLTRVTASGTVPLGFGGGLDLNTAGAYQDEPAIAPDGSGGVLVAYEDNITGNYDVTLERVGATGAALWTTLVTPGVPGDQRTPQIAGDGAGGAWVSWTDNRNGVDNDAYIDHILMNGAQSYAFPSYGGGIVGGTGAGDQNAGPLVADGTGGVYATWAGGILTYGYTLVHYGAGGVEAPGWGSGVAVTPGSFTGFSDGAGGIIVGISGFNGSGLTVVAEHYDSDASHPIGWGSDVIAAAFAGGEAYYENICSDGAGGVILVWTDDRRLGTESDVYAQRIERFGQLGNPEPVIADVGDVKDDQGGHVRVSWLPSFVDAAPGYGVADYRVWRQAPAAAAQAALARGRAVLDDGTAPVAPASASRSRSGAAPADAVAPARRTFRTTIAAGQIVYWELLASQPAAGYPAYSMVVPTTSDSTAAGNPYTLFMVDAVAYSGAMWSSAPDSGYSVDNLAPAVPAPFTGTWSYGAGASLFWGANSEPDLAGYRLYRGASASFVPGPSNLVVQKASPGYLDAGAPAAYYKLSAIDIHGNESGFALLLPSGTLAVGDRLPAALALAPATPNPARGAARIGYALPRAARVSLAVYDASGRRVRQLVSGDQEPGEWSAAWDGRDEAGAPAGSGLYFVRLEAEGRVLTERVAFLR